MEFGTAYIFLLASEGVVNGDRDRLAEPRITNLIRCDSSVEILCVFVAPVADRFDEPQSYHTSVKTHRTLIRFHESSDKYWPLDEEDEFRWKINEFRSFVSISLSSDMNPKRRDSNCERRSPDVYSTSSAASSTKNTNSNRTQTAPRPWRMDLQDCLREMNSVMRVLDNNQVRLAPGTRSTTFGRK